MNNLLGKDGGIEGHHHLPIPAKYNCKKDMAQDVRLLFTDRVKVKFIRDGNANTLEGRWCKTCR
jgi:hypothetical protein